MPLPTTFSLLRAKSPHPTPELHAQICQVPNKQARLAGRIYLQPEINLNIYRFHAVIDWVEVEFHFDRLTQVQHVQAALRTILDRDSYIKPFDLGSGSTFNRCAIRIQEPKNCATLALLTETLRGKLGETAEARVRALEVSLDVYPKEPSDSACEALLATLQRTIWTPRDIWYEPNARPRIAFGKERHERYKLSPGPENDRQEYSRLIPENHKTPPIDATMYLGAREDEMMIRLMHKTIDRQHSDGTHYVLPQEQRRVRIETCLQGGELDALGITTIASLRRFRFSAIQARYFQFKLPTFDYRDTDRKRSDLTHNTREAARALTFLRAGTTATDAMDQAIKISRQNWLRGLRTHLRNTAAHLPSQRTPRRAISHLSWSEMNQKANFALQGLDRRETTAWERLTRYNR